VGKLKLPEPLFEDSLRGFIGQSLDIFYQKIAELGLVAMESAARKKIGPIESRIGVFGPYAGEGKVVLDKVAREISQLGYASLMGDGFYLPKHSDEFHKIEEIIPPAVKTTIQTIIMHSSVFYRLFPRLTSKAVFNLSELRSQILELEGCLESGIPSLGFIVHENIDSKGKNCPYLFAATDHSICKVPNKLLCPYHYKGLKIFCPFFDSVNIPWLVKQVLFSDANHMVAIRNLSNLTGMLEEFLGAKKLVRVASSKELEVYCEEFINIHRKILRKDLNYRILSIVSLKKGSLVFFDFTPNPGSFEYKLTDTPINLELMELPQTGFTGDLSKVDFEGTNIVRERNKLIIVKGDNTKRVWSEEEARRDAFRELAAVGKILSEET